VHGRKRSKGMRMKNACNGREESNGYCWTLAGENYRPASTIVTTVVREYGHRGYRRIQSRTVQSSSHVGNRAMRCKRPQKLQHNGLSATEYERGGEH